MDIFEKISFKLIIILGIFMYIFGLIGSVLNIIVFTKWIYSRKTINNNSSLYLLTTSISNLILILYPLLIRILVDGYEYFITSNNAFFLCKLRYYILQTTLLISLICTCMATFDRYLITSRNVNLRQMSSTKSVTMKIILSIISLNCLHSIPTAYYHHESSNGTCILSSNIYSYYYLYIVIVFLYGIFPLCFLLIFGTLTYKQLTEFQQRNFNMDKQLSRMVLFQCIAIILSSIPYCIQEIYFYNKDLSSLSYVLLFRTTAVILFYINPVINFYIFFISTPNFRSQVKLIFRPTKRRNNQVTFINTNNN